MYRKYQHKYLDYMNFRIIFCETLRDFFYLIVFQNPFLYCLYTFWELFEKKCYEKNKKGG